MHTPPGVPAYSPDLITSQRGAIGAFALDDATVVIPPDDPLGRYGTAGRPRGLDDAAHPADAYEPTMASATTVAPMPPVAPHPAPGAAPGSPELPPIPPPPASPHAVMRFGPGPAHRPLIQGVRAITPPGYAHTHAPAPSPAPPAFAAYPAAFGHAPPPSPAFAGFPGTAPPPHPFQPLPPRVSTEPGGLPSGAAFAFGVVAVVVALFFDLVFLRVHVPGLGGYAWYITTALSFAAAGYAGAKWTRATQVVSMTAVASAAVAYGIADVGLGLGLEGLTLGGGLFLGAQGLVIALLCGGSGVRKALSE